METPRSVATGLAFLAYMISVGLLAFWAGRFLSKPKSFASEYFLGNRSMSSWALALSFAATCISGGTFAGFPALIYSQGWIMFLWIGSYMVFPLVAMGLMGKRLNQLSHRTGAITIPDILRDRFDSPALALFASLAIVFFITVNLVAQFKSGAIILDVLLRDTPGYSSTILPWFQSLLPGNLSVGPGYVFSLFLFALTVVLYTMYGGFRAVVWTDVLQGVVMLVGVMILLPTVLIKAGGLAHATTELARKPPSARITSGPMIGIEYVQASDPQKRVWVEHGGVDPRSLRVQVQVGYSITPFPERVTVVVKIPVDQQFRPLATIDEVVQAVNESPEARPFVTARAIGNSSSEIIPMTKGPVPLVAGESHVYGPSLTPTGQAFHPLGMAISFFFFWSFSGAGHPGFLVRLLAFRDSKDLRYSMVTVTIYFALIYIPLVFIFIAARTLIDPSELPAGPDSVMPTVATKLVHPLLAGILIAAPYSAVMSTVSSFLLVISSSLVRDLYQRRRGAEASERTVTILSYLATGGIGLLVTVLALDPPAFLQDVVVFASSGISATFLAALLLAVYWPGMTLAGAWCSMITGFVIVVGAHLPIFLHRLGWVPSGQPIILLGLDPFVWACAVSLILGVVVSGSTRPTSEKVLQTYFGRRPARDAEMV
jgi:Na+/pantothenate symporter